MYLIKSFFLWFKFLSYSGFFKAFPKLKKSPKVYVGIRAEDIVPSENSTDAEKKGWNFEKSIDLAEPLGTETQLFFKLNDKDVISRMYNPRVIEVGEKIKFEVDLEKIHLFDHETEKAI